MQSSLSRRDLLKGLAALSLAQSPIRALALGPSEVGGVVVPFLDVQPPGKMLRWQDLTQWVTPNEQVFAVSHYGTPAVEADRWKLEITGLVNQPKALTLAEIHARKRKTITATLECSGNGSNPAFMGAVGNVRWTGTPLGPLLRECGLDKRAIEVVFFGADEKTEKIREKEYLQNFARSLSREQALGEDMLLAYEMNGEPLSREHGAPLRLVAPGWFGIAWVKWLSRIEALDRRYMSKYMAREYVTIRGEERDGRTIWRETSVGPIAIKSVLARAVRLKNGTIRFSGAAWSDGTAIERVDIQIDGGPWRRTQLDRPKNTPYAWRFWQYDWDRPDAGDHTVVSRAVDAAGRVQPTPTDPSIQLKRTYWEANQQWPRKLRI